MLSARGPPLLPPCRAFSAAALVTGVVAQYLELFPEASPAQVKAALLAQATPNAIMGAGNQSVSTSLLYTTFAEPVSTVGPLAPAPAPAGTQAGQEEGSSGLGASAIVGLALGILAGERGGAGSQFTFVVRFKLHASIGERAAQQTGGEQADRKHAQQLHA